MWCRNPRCQDDLDHAALIPLCRSCRLAGGAGAALAAVVGFLLRWVGVLTLLWCMLPAEAGAQVPPRAAQFQRLLLANARAVWGLDAPIAVLASQIHQESSWRPDARSPYAGGLSQFTPDTADWISQKFPYELGQNQPFNPNWALRALARYDKWLYDRVARASNDCSKWGQTLSGYNGGEGWRRRDQELAARNGADPARWFGHVERFSARAKWAFDENRTYVRRILLEIQPRYLLWDGGVDCSSAIVAVLGRIVGPSQIAWVVSKVVVDSVDRKAWWPRTKRGADVRRELSVVINPWFVHRDAAAAIVHEGGVAMVETALLDVDPCPVQVAGRSAFAVSHGGSPVCCSQSLFVEAATRHGVSVMETGEAHGRLGSASAATPEPAYWLPAIKNTFGLREHRQSPEDGPRSDGESIRDHSLRRSNNLAVAAPATDHVAVPNGWQPYIFRQAALAPTLKSSHSAATRPGRINFPYHGQPAEHRAWHNLQPPSHGAIVLREVS